MPQPSSRKARLKTVGRRRPPPPGAGRAGSCEGARQDGAWRNRGCGSGEASRRDEGARQEGSGHEVPVTKASAREVSDESSGGQRHGGDAPVTAHRRAGGGRRDGQQQTRPRQRPPRRPRPKAPATRRPRPRAPRPRRHRPRRRRRGRPRPRYWPRLPPAQRSPARKTAPTKSSPKRHRPAKSPPPIPRRRLTCGSPPGTSTRCGARQERVEEWLTEVQPDVVMLQETKLADDAFPRSRSVRSATRVRTTGRASGTAWPSCRRSASRTSSSTSPAMSSPTPMLDSSRRRAAGCASLSVYVPNGRTLDDPHCTYKLRGSIVSSPTSTPTRHRRPPCSWVATSTSPPTIPTCTTRPSSSVRRT